MAACVTAMFLAAPALALTVTKVNDLSFGKLVPGLGSGTVVISATGLRTASNGVILFTQGGDTSQPARFNLTDGPTAPASCAVSLPANNVVTLSYSSSSMATIKFTSSVTGSYTFDTGNAQTATINFDGSGSASISVGGTLSVAGSQAAGNYDTTNLTLTVSCP